MSNKDIIDHTMGMAENFTCPQCGGHHWGTSHPRLARNIVECHNERDGSPCGWRGTRVEAGLPLAKEFTIHELVKTGAPIAAE